MMKTPPYIIGHFPHPSGWRYSWIDENGHRQESASYGSRNDARLAAKEHAQRFKAQFETES